MNLLKSLFALLITGVYREEDKPFKAHAGWDVEPEEVKEEEIIEDKNKEPGEEAGKEEEIEDENKEESTDDESKETKEKETIEDKEDKAEQDETDDTDEEIPEKITLGKKEIPTEELTELYDELKKDFDDDELEKLEPKTLEKLLTKSYQIKEGSKVINERHQENAKTKKELDAEKVQIEAEKNTLETTKKKIEAEIKRVADLKATTKEIAEKDISDEFDEDARIDAKLEKKAAEKELKALSDYEKNLKEKQKNLTSQEIAVQAKINIRELQASHPELMTKEPIENILSEYSQKGEYPDRQELIKARRIQKVLREYYDLENPTLPIAKFYDDEKYNYPELPAPTVKKEVKKDKPLKDLLRKLSEKQKNSSPQPNKISTGGGRSTVTEENSGEAYANKTGWGASLDIIPR